jgi:hypothetical protein
MFLCRSVAEPQRDLGAQALPSHTRSPDPKVVVDSLADDAGTATPPPGAAEKRTTSPPVVDSKVASPPRAGDTGAGGADGDVRTLASPRIIDVDPIISRPAGADLASEAQRRLAHRYLILLHRARGCRDERLTAITLISIMISSMTMRIRQP